jgi:predicted nucleic acid-binding protein
MTNKIAVGDADSLIALVIAEDTNHMKAKKISRLLSLRGIEVVYPNTAILEAITALRRALNSPDLAQLINSQYLKGGFTVEYIDEKIQLKASERWAKADSKKNTIFDAVVVETVIKLKADYIFSFDDWYRKIGFSLALELI